ncbi:MAG: flagellar hook-associated protein FlgK [Litorilituus sp.]|jgi:flagellar hook-associated protein 1 FlgK|nr:flagellar hook-associated protein FlgK [Litorilituus sp.]
MTVSLYQTGVSGLLAAQQQLATTGHNISNVNTEGYTRQRAEQNASLGLNNGSNYLGSGTYIQDITRLYDKFAYKEQLSSHSNLGSADFLGSRLNQLDRVMSVSGNSVIDSLGLFYQALNGVADNPNDAGLRSIVLTQASTLTNNFNELDSDFEQMHKSVNGEIEQMASKVSEISLQIAKINDTILHSQDPNQVGQPNDLLDQRDQLITELSEYTHVNTVLDQNGVMSVMIGQGTTLVAGITPLTIQARAGDPDPLKTDLALVGKNSSVAIDGSSLGGALAASIEFRDEHLSHARREVDRLAMAISSTINDSQASGLDLNGLQGINIFTDINASNLQQGRVLGSSANSGNLDAQVQINNVSLLPTDEFEVRFDGTNYVMTNMTSGATETLGMPGTGPFTPSSPDYGFTFVENSGTPSADDTFIIKPTRNSASFLNVTLTDNKAIAASGAVGVTPSSHNVSAGEITITNVTDPQAARTYDLTVDVYESAPNIFEYRVYNTATPPPAPTLATGTYAAGGSVTVDIPAGSPAFQIEITGDMTGAGTAAREEFSIGDAFGMGNGTNAVAMAKTQEQGVINGNKETFNQSLAITTSVIGSKASNAELVADTAQAMFTQAFNRNQETSGVNLDEEAANLMKFQQAYQAASQIISTANTIFDTVLSAVR